MNPCARFCRLLFFVALASLCGGAAPAQPRAAKVAPPVPQQDRVIGAPSYVLMDVDTGRVLASRNMHQRRFPASTTKTMTALLAIEKDDLKSVVTIGPNPPKTGESSIYLQKGEQLMLHELVEAAMIRSANDACVAIAESVAGSVSNFARKMNARAKQLGAVNTHFVNPHGLHDPQHFTTAYDLALIAREAMRHPVFNEMVRTRETTIRGPAKVGGVRQLRNRNRLLFRWNEADGVKTGYTRQAGRCLIASATRVDSATGRPWRLLSVVLHAPDSWSDSVLLLRREGFEKYSPTVVARGGETLADIFVEGGSKGIAATATKEIRLPLLPSEQVALTSHVHALERAAPIEKGQTVAWLEWRLNHNKIASVPLVARDAVDKSLMAKVVPAAAPLVPSQPLLRWSVYALATSGVLFLWAGLKVRSNESKRQRQQRQRRRQARRLAD